VHKQLEVTQYRVKVKPGRRPSYACRRRRSQTDTPHTLKIRGGAPGSVDSFMCIENVVRVDVLENMVFVVNPVGLTLNPTEITFSIHRYLYPHLEGDLLARVDADAAGGAHVYHERVLAGRLGRLKRKLGAHRRQTERSLCPNGRREDRILTCSHALYS